MTTPTTTELLKYANLQMAAEAFLEGVKTGTPQYSDDALQIALIKGNFHSSKFTATQAANFLEHWEVLDQRANTPTGFSGTLFRCIKSDSATGAQAGELVMSLRSTEFIDDAARDNQATNVLEVKATGFAWGQLRDMQEWYQNLRGDPAKLGTPVVLGANQPFSVTGYSLGGHLASAFNLMYGADAGVLPADKANLTKVVTFNAAGIGGIDPDGPNATLKSLVDLFATQSKKDYSADIVDTELQAIYLRIKAACHAGEPVWASDITRLAELASSNGEIGVSDTVKKAQQVQQAWWRVDDIRKEVGRLTTLESGDTPVSRPKEVSNTDIAQEDLDYQMAVLEISRHTSATSLLGGASRMFGNKVNGVTLPNQFDVVGAAHSLGSSTFNDPSAVANSQLHIGTDIRVIIEDQPLVRGAPLVPVIWSSLAYHDAKLLVNNFSNTDFGDTHSLVLLVDSLNVQNALLQLLPADQRDAAAPVIAQTLADASNRIRVDGAMALGTSQGKAEGDVLENTLNALADLVLGPTEAALHRLKGSPDGNTWSKVGNIGDYTGRTEFYKTLALIQGSKLYEAAQAGTVSLQLSAAVSPTAAQARADFGAYAALCSLSPFAFTVADTEASALLLDATWGEVYQAWKRDKEILAADANATTTLNISQNWLEDRAALLERKDYYNKNNASYDSSQPNAYGQTANQYDALDTNGFTGDVVWDDRASDTKIVRGGVTLTTRYVVFAGDLGDSAVTGGRMVDHLYGGKGDDVLNGGGGADVMEGGGGNDTYYVDSEVDSVTETSAGGFDTVHVTGDAGLYRLSANLENLVADAGARALSLYGNAEANTILGNSTTVLLEGGAGNDRLIDIAGNAKLNGGTDVNTYWVASGDVVTDGAGQETIYIQPVEALSVPNPAGYPVVDPASYRFELGGNKAANLFVTTTTGGFKLTVNNWALSLSSSGALAAGQSKTQQIIGPDGTTVLITATTVSDGEGGLITTSVGYSGNTNSSHQGQDGTVTSVDTYVTGLVANKSYTYSASGTVTKYRINNTNGTYTWTENYADGSHETCWTETSGFYNDTVVRADGSSTTNYKNANQSYGYLIKNVGGSSTSAYFYKDGSGTITHFAASGALTGSEKHAVDGSVTKLTVALDGSTSVSETYNPQNVLVASLSKGLNGYEAAWTLNSDGSTRLTTHDNSGASTDSTTALSGTVVASYVNAIGTYGNSTTNADGTGTSDQFAANGSQLGHTATGGASAETLTGVEGVNNTLSGGTGNDLLLAGTGNDTYLYHSGDGADVITDVDGAADKVQLTGLTSSAAKVRRVGNDMSLTFAGTDQSLTVTDWFLNNANKIESFVFDDATLTAAEMETRTRTVVLTEASDTYVAPGAEGYTISGLGGYDNITGGAGADVLSGGAYYDVLAGGAGADTYLFNQGDWGDVITESGESAPASGPGDTVKFGAGLTAADWSVTRYGTDLMLARTGSHDSLTVKNWYTTEGSTVNQVESVLLADGSVAWTAGALTTLGLNVTGTAGADVMQGLATYANVLNGGDGADILYGASGADSLYGGAGNDYIDGGAGQDYLSGGAGDDMLGGPGPDRGYLNTTGAYISPGAGNVYEGGTGNDVLNGTSMGDTYKFNLGDGADAIADYEVLGQPSGQVDTIEFGAGINPADIYVSRSGNNLQLRHVNGQDSITIFNWYRTASSTDNQVERVTFSNNVQWTAAELTTRGLTVVGSAGGDVLTGIGDYANVLDGRDGDDSIYGGTGDDTLWGGNGNDQLLGQAGNDHLYGGDGNDYLDGGPDVDFLDGGAGNDIMFGSENNDQLWGGTGNDAMHGGSGDDLLMGESGDDLLYGESGTNTLNGGLGNDTLYSVGTLDQLWGAGGYDSYVIGTGLGTHVVHEDSDGGIVDVSSFFSENKALTAYLIAADQLCLNTWNGEVVVISGWAAGNVGIRTGTHDWTAAEINQQFASHNSFQLLPS